MSDHSSFPSPFILFPLSLPLLGLVGLFLSGCAFHPPEPCIKHGKVYGITDDWIISHDWDSCYRRAVSYARGECWTQAISQFRLSIRQRPNDQWRARSYGMHVLDEYFPHREMGIIYLQQGKLEEAIEELTISLATADSAKAKYYLNQARKGWLEKTGLDRNLPCIRFYVQPDLTYEQPDISYGKPEVSQKQPNITYEQPDVSKKWLYTNMDTFSIQGEALDDYYVSSIQVNEHPLFIDLAKPLIPFSKKVSLKTGENHFLFKVTDLTGKDYQEELRIFLDQQGPSLFFSPKGTPEQLNPSQFNPSEHPTEKKDQANKTIIRGMVYDTGGLHTLVIGEKEIPLMRGITHKEFQIAIPLSESPTFWARDLAGNITRGDLAYIWNVNEWKTGEQDIKGIEMSGHTDNIENGFPHINWNFLNLIHSGPSGKGRFRPVRVAANGPLFAGLISGRRDDHIEKAPRIFIEDCPTTVFQPSVVILGRIESWSEITEAWINDEPLLSPTKDNGLLQILRRFWHGERTLFYFTRLIKGLKEGENNLTIRVKDREGRSTRKDIRVEYRVQEIERIGNRWCLAILPFQVQEMDLPIFADPQPGPLSFLTEGLHLSFFRTKRFRLVERDRIDSVMNELGMKSSYAVDETTGPRLGKLLVAEVLLSGSFREGWDGRDRCLEIVGRLVDVETSDVLSIKSVYNRWQNKKDEAYLLSGLAQIFQHEFPLVQGKVLNKKRSDIEISINADDFIKTGMKVLVYRPVEGKKQSQQVLGEAKVEYVDQACSIASPSEEKILKSVRIGDLVITK